MKNSSICDIFLKKQPKDKQEAKQSKQLSGKREKPMFFKFAQQGFLSLELRTYSTIGFKGHTGAIFYNTGLTGNGTSILCCH